MKKLTITTPAKAMKKAKKLRQKRKNFSVSVTPKSGIIRKIKKKSPIKYKKGGKLTVKINKKWLGMSCEEVKVTVKKITTFFGKKPETKILWECKVAPEHLEIFMLNMFVMPTVAYKHVAQAIDDIGIFTVPCVITNYDNFRNGVKKRKPAKGTKLNSVKTLTIEALG